jgi:hypothetical protein
MPIHPSTQSDIGPLVVKPRTACRMLDCGNTRLYELLGTGELESFLDGRSRKITVDSIRRYVAQRLASSQGTTAQAQAPRRKRGRPRKSSSVVMERPCSP